MTKHLSKNLATLIIGGSAIVAFLAGVAIGLGDGEAALGNLLPWLGGLFSLPALLLALKEEKE